MKTNRSTLSVSTWATRIVDAAMGDVIATLGQAVSQLVGIGRVDQLDARPRLA